MSVAARALAAAVLVLAFSLPAHADRKTVCTITVNSPDEKDIFRRSLPPGQYDFVELVEKGRPDWLASACRRNVRCDALIISGHFDGGAQFYSDRLDARESLPTDELQRASCSASCAGLFAQLKEVYLFGCNTLNAEPAYSASPEVVRSLLRAGHLPPDADRITRALETLHGDSNRDRMRRIFHDVPVIYGFSAKAPLGAAAGPVLARYFQNGGAAEIGSGRPSSKLLGLFAPVSMTAASGVTDADGDAAYRRDLCRLSDDARTLAQKLRFVHELLARESAETRMFLDVIEQTTAKLHAAERAQPEVREALDAIVQDRAARTRFLAFARDADEAATRTRMIDVAARLGWLSEAQRRAELVRMIADQLARAAVTPADVELVCELNRDGVLGREAGALPAAAPASGARMSEAALMACLGSEEGHVQVLRALTSARDADLQMAQVYLRHHPVTDARELRGIAADVARTSDTAAQIGALETLAGLQVSDRETLEALARLFPATHSLSVQRAIAGILIRSDDRVLEKPALVRVLRQHRLKSPDGQDVIDVLIRRWQTSS